MNITVIGTGYVGLVTGTCFAEMGNRVWCLDVDKKKIDGLKSGKIPIYEPGLEEMVKRNHAEKRLFFSTDYAEAVPGAEVCFIAVGTPPSEDGSADLKYVLQAARSIAEHLSDYAVIVDKSTVPVGTSELVRRTIAEVITARGAEIEFDVVSNPEFLKEGVAIDDFMRPDRVVIGSDSDRAERIMRDLYEPFVRNQHPVLCMDIKSAEITKYAANAMLALRISFMNEVAGLCARLGGDISCVRQGIGTDNRIGMSFLYAGIGYGGSCFPKDVKELVALGDRNGIEMSIAKAVEDVNERQKLVFVDKIVERLGPSLAGKTVALWGLAFKPQTDDVRESPALALAARLRALGARVRAYDPEAMGTALSALKAAGVTIECIDDQYEVLAGADTLVLATEWKQFRQPDFAEIKSRLARPLIFDGRNQYDPSHMKELGFEYHCIGKNA